MVGVKRAGPVGVGVPVAAPEVKEEQVLEKCFMILATPTSRIVYNYS
jgi:hypothetical protein